MEDRQGIPDLHETAFEAFGVKVALTANRPELLERMRSTLPAGWEPCEPSTVDRRFGLTVQRNGTCQYLFDEHPIGPALELELALELLDTQLRTYLGVNAPEVILVHAGAVAHRGAMIVIPGDSFAGKTTLVAALVRAGATYYSDEFAVIDQEGLVHPYAKPLSVRGNGKQTNRSVESLGWTPGSKPLPLGMIAVTSYRPGGQWRPRQLSSGEGAMALLAKAVPARERPAQAMRSLSRAATDAIAIQSERGEADELAPLLLAELERLTV